MATSSIDGHLNKIRRGFLDRATLHYFGDPDDFDDPWKDILAEDDASIPYAGSVWVS